MGAERNNEPCNPEPASDPSRPIVPCACRFPVARRRLRPVNSEKKANWSANIPYASSKGTVRIPISLTPTPNKREQIGDKRKEKHTTVNSSNGLAVSIFPNVFSNALTSSSTRPFVSSALFTACPSNASIAFNCRPTSYVTGFHPLKCVSISSTTAPLVSAARYLPKSTVCGWVCKAASLRRASSLRFLKAWREVAVLPLRPREVVMRVQSIFVAAERWRGVVSRGFLGH